MSQVLQAAAKTLAAYCTAGAVSPHTSVGQEVLTRMNADQATIIVPPSP